MSLSRIRARPELIQISHGRSVLVTSPTGIIGGTGDHGLYVDETRLISRWGYRIDGREPVPNASSVVEQHCWCGYFLTTPPGVPLPPRDHGSGQVPDYARATLELRVLRTINDGMHEELELTNYSGGVAELELILDVELDLADQSDADDPAYERNLDVTWSESEQTLEARGEWRKDSRAVERGVRIRFSTSDRTAAWSQGRVTWRVRLAPQERWNLSIRAQPLAASESSTVAATAGGNLRTTDADVEPLLEPLTQITGPTSRTYAMALTTIEQARRDLASMRLPGVGASSAGWTVAAGLPLYLSLFGRDTLTAGWQAGILGPEMMIGALDVLSSLQGRVIDDTRDEQPGRMLHEAHTGPLAQLGYHSRDRSYSSITTSGLFGFVLAELWHWTGNRDLVDRYVEPALRAFEWLDGYGDMDGDGFYEYEARSPFGPTHQAWKDSPDAVVHVDGTEVSTPIATCEEQAFVYAARLHMAETLWSLGRHETARSFLREAAELKQRFNEAFWMEDESTFALALDGRKRQVRSIASNAAHCIAAGIVDDAKVPRLIERLFEADLFSGWGIRTLSTSHPRYNPFSYHLGSVWPVEQGTFALGFWRYGFHDRVQQIARAQFDAAAMFEHNRLPELFGGHPRDANHPLPGIYPNSNPLQAWSSSSVLMLVQAMLGLYPYAPLRLLVLDPHLPEWLPDLTLRNLRVGEATATIRFRRGRDGRTRIRVVDRTGDLRVLRQASPWSLTAGSSERISDALASLVAHIGRTRG